MDWEACYQRGETPWDKSAPAPELLSALQNGYLHGTVLVPGCGRGHDVRAIADANPVASEVTGLDISPSAILEAIKMGHPANTHFVEGDLFNLPLSWKGRFDWVWEHTCFCALPPGERTSYVKAVRSALNLGGHLLAVFFLDPGLDDPQAGPPFGVTKPELDALFTDSFVLKGEWAPRATYKGREGSEWVRLLEAR